MPSEWLTGDVIQKRLEVQDVKRGGMGIVLELRDRETGRKFAAKTFRDDILSSSPSLRQRFIDECRAMVRMGRHQNIVLAESVEVLKGKPYLFMEWIEGGTLGGLIHTLSAEKDTHRVVSFALQFCRGMMHANSSGIAVHRDIKPDNCFIVGHTRLRIADFGLAKILDGVPFPKIGGVARDPRRLAPYATRTGALLGTPPYMAPELFDDPRHADVRADIYSFGVTLYEMIAGRLPFYAQPGEWEVLHKEIVPPALPRTSPDLRGLINKCLSKKPEERFTDFGEVADELTLLFEKASLTGERPAPKRAPRETRQHPNPNVDIQRELAQFSQRPRIPANVSRDVLVESGHRCAVCGDPCPLERAHIIPFCDSQDHSLKNLICLCANCHERADKEQWGPRTLREYKRLPWVRRKYTDSPAAQPIMTKVEIRIDLEYEDFDQRSGSYLQHALAGFLRIPPEYVELKSVSEGSVRVVVVLPEVEADQLMRAHKKKDPKLSEHLAPLDLLGIHRETERRKRLCPVQSDIDIVARLLAEGKTEKAWDAYIRSRSRTFKIPIVDMQEACAKAESLHNLGRYQEALQWFDRALEILPKADVWSGKSSTLRALGQLEEALECSMQAIRLEPNRHDLWMEKGNILLDLKRALEAEDCFKKAFDLLLSGNPALRSELIRSSPKATDERRPRYGRLLQEALIRLDPQDSCAWHNKGNAFFRAGKYEAALECYDKATAINPGFADAWNNKGATLQELKNYEDALDCFDRALSIAPESGRTLYNRGMVLVHLGRVKEALDCFNRAAHLGNADAKEKAARCAAVIAYSENRETDHGSTTHDTGSPNHSASSHCAAKKEDTSTGHHPRNPGVFKARLASKDVTMIQGAVRVAGGEIKILLEFEILVQLVRLGLKPRKALSKLSSAVSEATGKSMVAISPSLFTDLVEETMHAHGENKFKGLTDLRTPVFVLACKFITHAREAKLAGYDKTSGAFCITRKVFEKILPAVPTEEYRRVLLQLWIGRALLQALGRTDQELDKEDNDFVVRTLGPQKARELAKLFNQIVKGL